VSIRRQAARRDGNEPAIVDALEAIGVVVHRLSAPGLPDLLCWHPREGLRLIEVKMPGERLTIQQETVRLRMPFFVVESVADALALYSVFTERVLA